MLKKFAEGLFWGAGFAFSFIILWYLAAYFIEPVVSQSQIEKINRSLADLSDEQSSRFDLKPNPGIFSEMSFRDMDIDQMIKVSSVIALARYESAPDGRMLAIITEILKKEDGVKFHFKIGDEYQSASYFPRENTRYGDGIIIFFTGSPASMRMSMSFDRERIGSLGDISLDLIRAKVNGA